jgi:CBS domain-containing protein
MKVRQLLSSKGREVVTAGAGDTVASAIGSMQGRNISALIVEEAGRPVGIFTERDVLRAYLAAGGRDFGAVALREAMTVNLVVAELDDDLTDVMAVMTDRNIRHLPVVDRGALVGMLSVRDVVQSQVQKLTSEIHYLKDYIASS